tara:strand:+ start:284 stop:493 length:210 start_codon:yes stop_codon:yes gene_type:complete
MIKVPPYLPENTFILSEDTLPKDHDTDRFGKIMVFRKDIGWSVIPLTDAVQYLAMKHTHWTFTPDTPYE